MRRHDLSPRVNVSVEFMIVKLQNHQPIHIRTHTAKTFALQQLNHSSRVARRCTFQFHPVQVVHMYMWSLPSHLGSPFSRSRRRLMIRCAMWNLLDTARFSTLFPCPQVGPAASSIQSAGQRRFIPASRVETRWQQS